MRPGVKKNQEISLTELLHPKMSKNVVNGRRTVDKTLPSFDKGVPSVDKIPQTFIKIGVRC